MSDPCSFPCAYGTHRSVNRIAGLKEPTQVVTPSTTHDCAGPARAIIPFPNQVIWASRRGRLGRCQRTRAGSGRWKDGVCSKQIATQFALRSVCMRHTCFSSACFFHPHPDPRPQIPALSHHPLSRFYPWAHAAGCGVRVRRVPSQFSISRGALRRSEGRGLDEVRSKGGG